MEHDQLTAKYKPLNMLGFPDYLACQHVVDTLADVSINNQSMHQYTRGFVLFYEIIYFAILLISLVVGSSAISSCIEQILLQIIE